MQDIILGSKSNAIHVKVRKSLKAKNISLRIKTKDVELVIPKFASFDTARRFVLEKELWIRNQLRNVQIGSSLPDSIVIFGVAHAIVQNDHTIKNPIEIAPGKIILSSSIANMDTKWFLIKKLEQLVKQEIAILANFYATKLNVKFNRISIRDTSSRWGSCSSNKNLSFSWRLILAPKYVLEYVVIHELCHLIEMNHSKNFWQLVVTLCPDYRNAISWLKINGKKLHMIL